MDYINFLVIFNKGGIVMYPLLVCSVIAVAIGVERFLYYKDARVNICDLIGELGPALASDDWAGAAQVCKSKERLVADVLASGLKMAQNRKETLSNSLEGSATYSAAKLREKLNYLDTIITMSPLLGLLGTVVGMIQTFSVMNVKEGQTVAITGGIGEALIATATGLCVAILALTIHTYFSHQLDMIITDIEQASTLLINEAGSGELN